MTLDIFLLFLLHIVYEKTGSMTVTVECNPEVAELICKYMEEV